MVALLVRPFQRIPKVVVLGFKAIEGGRFPRGIEVRAQGLTQRRHPGGEAAVRFGEIAIRLCPLNAELPDRLQHAEPRLVADGRQALQHVLFNQHTI